MSTTVKFNYDVDVTDKDILECSLERLGIDFETQTEDLVLKNFQASFCGASFKKKGDAFELVVTGEDHIVKKGNLPSNPYGYAKVEDLTNAVVAMYELTEVEESYKAQGFTVQSELAINGTTASIVLGRSAG